MARPGSPQRCALRSTKRCFQLLLQKPTAVSEPRTAPLLTTADNHICHLTHRTEHPCVTTTGHSPLRGPRQCRMAAGTGNSHANCHLFCCQCDVSTTVWVIANGPRLLTRYRFCTLAHRWGSPRLYSTNSRGDVAVCLMRSNARMANTSGALSLLGVTWGMKSRGYAPEITYFVGRTGHADRHTTPAS